MTSSFPLQILIITTAILIISVVPLIIFYLSIVKNTKHWDDILLPLGFTGRMFMITGRIYSRNFGGHDLNVYVFKGNTLDIQMAIPVNAHFQVFQQGNIPLQIAGIARATSMSSQVPGLENLVFYPSNIPWLGKLLEGVRGAKAIRGLMCEGAEWAVYRQVELNPGILTYHLYENRGVNAGTIEQDTINRWILSLSALGDELLEAKLPHLDIPQASNKALTRLPVDFRLLVFIIAAALGLPFCMVLTFLILSLKGQNG
jgi:hypothetical protein